MSLHIIDDDGHLQSEKRLAEFLAVTAGTKAGNNEKILQAVGMNYHVVGVFGGQSSGKSTLLNRLFGTNFQTLDETVRRGQTTKGAFMATANEALEGFVAGGDPTAAASGNTDAADAAVGRSSDDEAGAGTVVSSAKAPLLVIDFEGTDGLERGEDQSFERHLSLFGLSVADTLIINMWAVDVGRFNAANLSLLRTIFEVNLQLFSHDNYEAEERPTLLIVLRDFTEDDPAPSLATIRKSFDTIWEAITRPSRFEKASIDALFDLKYYVMPHFKLQKEAFSESLLTLRHWFGDRHCKDYLFRHPTMFRGVPMEGLPAYLTNCWEAIRTSKDLDIPTQREMLAQHRCKEAKEQELHTFLNFTRHYDDRISRGEMLLRLSDVLDEEVSHRLTAFLKATKLYSSDVVSLYAAELEKELLDATMLVVDRFSKAIVAEVMSCLDTRVLNCVDACVRQCLREAQILPFASASAGEKAKEASAADEVAVPSTAASSSTPTHYINSAAARQLARSFWESLCTEINKVLGDLSAQPPPAHLYGRYTTLVVQDATARANCVNMVTDAVFAKLKSRFASMADNASETMHSGFERCLTHNTDGTVRFFATPSGLQKAVPSAVQSGMMLLDCLLYFRLKLVPVTDGDSVTDERLQAPASRSARRIDRNQRCITFAQNPSEEKFYLSYSTLDAAPSYPYDVPVEADGSAADDGAEASSILINESNMVRAYELFKQKCDFTTQLQLRAVEAGHQRLPAWVIPALFILGWNEMWYVITSPILLMLVIFICVFFFKQFFIAQWHAFEETGPATVVIPLQTALQVLYRTWSSLMGAPPSDSDRFQSPSQTKDRYMSNAAHVDANSKEMTSSSPQTVRHRSKPGKND